MFETKDQIDEEAVGVQVVGIIAGVLEASRDTVVPKASLMVDLDADQGFLLEIAYQLEQHFGLGEIVRSRGYNKMGQDGLKAITVEDITNLVLEELRK